MKKSLFLTLALILSLSHSVFLYAADDENSAGSRRPDFIGYEYSIENANGFFYISSDSTEGTVEAVLNSPDSGIEVTVTTCRNHRNSDGTTTHETVRSAAGTGNGYARVTYTKPDKRCSEWTQITFTVQYKGYVYSYTYIE